MDGTGDLFDEFVAALPSTTRAVVVSYPTDEPLDYAALESFVRSRLPAHDPFVLLAESFSGPVAVSIAASAPRGLRGLILVCSFVRSPRRSLGALAPLAPLVPVRGLPSAIFARALLGRSPSLNSRESLTRAIGRVSPTVLRARLRAVMDVDVSAAMSHVRVPVLYLRATDDRVVPRSASQLIARIAPSARIVDVHGPHLLLQTSPEACAREINAFLQEASG